jgi:predicted RNase H-like HicB family nuclease
MKSIYPILIQDDKEENCYIVDIPDFEISTWGKTILEAIENARDAIGLTAITIEDDGDKLPVPSELKDIKEENDSDIITLVDVDIDQYRKDNDTRAVKKNCTLPYWLEVKAEKENINFSAALQLGVKQMLGIQE